MAKGKKGPALFEVIRAAQQKQLEQQQKLERAKNQAPGVLHQAASLLGSPSAWLKGNRSAVARQEPVVAREPARATATLEAPAPAKPVVSTPIVSREIPAIIEMPAVAERVIQVVESKPIVSREVPVTVTPVAAAPAPIPAPARTPEPESAAAAAARAVREEIAATTDREDEAFVDGTNEPTIDSVSELFANPSSPAPKAQRKPWKLPKISIPSISLPAMPFKMTYTTGMVAGLAILAAAGIAFIATRSGDTQTPITQMNPRPELLNVDRDRPTQATPIASNTNKPADTAPRANIAQPQTTMTMQQQPPSAQAIKVPTNVKRKPGLQYVVLLSVPAQEAASANDLVKFLAANGIAATAEKALPGYSKSWYSVVTEKGFEKTRGVAEYDQFVSRCTKLMEQYAKGSKFKNFKPDTYTWRNPGQG